MLGTNWYLDTSRGIYQGGAFSLLSTASVSLPLVVASDSEVVSGSVNEDEISIRAGSEFYQYLRDICSHSAMAPHY